jgi:hypothetical protein
MVENHMAHFDSFPDGWDWSFVHLVQAGLVPPRGVVPQLSRIKNFGTYGVTMTKRDYAMLGLGDSPSSAFTATDFAEAFERGDFTVTDEPYLPPRMRPTSWFKTNAFPIPAADEYVRPNTWSKCPVCQGWNK